MEPPNHIWRCPTGEARDKLAERFGFLNEPWMQDWEYQVADHKRIDEFLKAYEFAGLSDDEKFTLMETIIESFRDLASEGEDISADPRWQRALAILSGNIPLHASTIWYWSCLDAENEDEMFCTSPFIRQIFEANRAYFAE